MKFRAATPPAGAESAWDVLLSDRRLTADAKSPILLGQIWRANRRSEWQGEQVTGWRREGAATELFFPWHNQRMAQVAEAEAEILKHATALSEEFSGQIEEFCDAPGAIDPPLRAWIESLAWEILRDRLINCWIILSLSDPKRDLHWLFQQVQGIYATYNQVTYRIPQEQVRVTLASDRVVLRGYGKSVALSWRSQTDICSAGPRKTFFYQRRDQWIIFDEEGVEVVNPTPSQVEQMLLYWPYLPGRDWRDPPQLREQYEFLAQLKKEYCDGDSGVHLAASSAR